MRFLFICINIVFWVLTVLSPAVSVERNSETTMTVEQVLDNYIEALGGRSAIENLDTRVCSGRVITDLPSRKPPVYEDLAFDGVADSAGCYRLNHNRPDLIDRVGFDGVHGWGHKGDSVRISDYDARSKLAFLLNPRGPLHIRDYFPGLKLTGTSSHYGGAAYVLEPSDLKMEYYSLYFDVESGLLVGIGYHWAIEDYRSVDGVMIPHKIICGRKGGSTTYVFRKIAHNRPVDDSLFAMPVTAGTFTNE